MKFKKIVGFGDSWVWGDELLDPALTDHPQAHPVLHLNTPYRESNCFLGLIGQHYGLPTENFGIAGGSLQSTIWTYLWWLKHETIPIDECIILIGLTGGDRITFYDPNHVSYANDPPWNKFVHSAWVNSDATCYSNQWTSTVKNLFVLSDCKELRQLYYEQALYFFEGQASIHNNNLLQFNTIWGREKNFSKTLIWPNQCLHNILAKQPNRKDLLAPNWHPNEKGHRVLADQLILEIDSCIIKGC